MEGVLPVVFFFCPCHTLISIHPFARTHAARLCQYHLFRTHTPQRRRRPRCLDEINERQTANLRSQAELRERLLLNIFPKPIFERLSGSLTNSTIADSYDQVSARLAANRGLFCPTPSLCLPRCGGDSTAGDQVDDYMPVTPPLPPPPF